MAGTASAWAQPVVDGFEAGALGPLWTTRAVPGRVTVQGDTIHSGASALRVALRPMVIYFDDYRKERVAD